ncbi:hypothetical protein [Longirhabdus pacifica]|uniref:hypothetical protein n=1 Tax=Longirhabdus pacifica TaxID=2305227 RepID=UPI001008C442|nr:hypothetical protein [Longirhabdus pacifica]
MSRNKTIKLSLWLIHICMFLLLLVIVVLCLYAFMGSQEMVPTAEQTEKVNIVLTLFLSLSIVLEIFLCWISFKLWKILKQHQNSM